MPPIHALLALHGIWIMLAIAVVVLAAQSLARRQLQLLGSAAVSVGAVGLLACTGYDLSDWLSTVPEDCRQFGMQRVLFYLGTTTELPLLPLTMAGAVIWLIGRRRNSTAVG